MQRSQWRPEKRRGLPVMSEFPGRSALKIVRIASIKRLGIMNDSRSGRTDRFVFAAFFVQAVEAAVHGLEGRVVGVGVNVVTLF